MQKPAYPPTMAHPSKDDCEALAAYWLFVAHHPTSNKETRAVAECEALHWLAVADELELLRLATPGPEMSEHTELLEGLDAGKIRFVRAVWPLSS